VLSDEVEVRAIFISGCSCEDGHTRTDVGIDPCRYCFSIRSKVRCVREFQDDVCMWNASILVLNDVQLIYNSPVYNAYGFSSGGGSAEIVEVLARS
jgi:hypothetical protein